METQVSHRLEWQDPLDFCHSCLNDSTHSVLLYSGLKTRYSGEVSVLATHPLETVSGDSFEYLRPHIHSDTSAYEHAWFGFFSYELLHQLETLQRSPSSYITLPPLWFCRFGCIYVFDHHQKTLTLHRHPSLAAPVITPRVTPQETSSWKVSRFTSPMRKADYLAHVRTIKEGIFAGAFYQANLTRKFVGEFEKAPDSFALFKVLCLVSPAPYSAYIHTPEWSILSSSPERFLTVSHDGRMESRPIKGTARRFSDPHADKRSKDFLATSEKDKAENLMIVDLMRNDFSRVCETRSVKVENLFEVASFATVHHMDSTIIGQKRNHLDTLDAVKACFPPGSMTGAPKVEAMRWCSRLENVERGVYSGALGWFGGDGSADLSVVIRTLVLQGRNFEFQVGGGIVADSDPESEWEETITKARGLLHTLGITEDALRAL